MPTKKGAGGRQQNYDPNTGRFAKTDYASMFPIQISRRERARKRESARREVLYNRALNSKDPLLFEVYCAIEKELPGAVQLVNENKFDPFLGRGRELDIVTRKCIIEVKSGKKPKGLTQFLGQKAYAVWKNKTHIVFAPQMALAAKRAHERNGITIIRDYNLLLATIKEYEK